MTHTFGPLAKGIDAAFSLAKGGTVQQYSGRWARRNWDWHFAITLDTRFYNATPVIASLGQPTRLETVSKTVSPGTNRLYLASDLIQADGFMNGRTADVYVATNGVGSLLCTGTITATKTSLIDAALPNQNFTRILFDAGTAAFTAGETLTGGTSGATATIDYVFLTSGTFAGNNAAGQLVLSSVSGTFQNNETITSAGGSATADGGTASQGYNVVVTGTTAEAALLSFWRNGVPYWYRVAALDANRVRGTWSSWASYTAPSNIGTSTATNTVQPTLVAGDGGALAAPANVAAAAKSGDTSTAVITWDAVSGASAYFVQISYQDPTLNVTEPYVDIDTTGVEIPAGASVFIHKTMDRQHDKYSARVWEDAASYTLFQVGTPEERVANTDRRWIAYTGGDPAPNGYDAEYYLQVPMAGAGNILNGPLHWGVNSIGEESYRILHPSRNYKALLVARASSAVTASLAIDGVDVGGSASFNLTTSWQTFEHTFSRATVLTSGSLQNFALSVPSAVTVEVAQWLIFDTTKSFHQFRDEDAANIVQGTFVRDGHAGQQVRGMSMKQICSDNFHSFRRQGLPIVLRRMQEYGNKPHLQIEFMYQDADYLNFVAFMAAPAASGHPYANMRAAQGRTDPWVDAFDRIVLEFGNEAWHTGSPADFSSAFKAALIDTATSADYSGNFAGATFGIHCQRIIDVMKTSPYWDAFRRKVMFYIGGFAPINSFALDVLARAPDIDGVGPAAYNGGWEQTTARPDETGATFKPMLRAFPSVSTYQTTLVTPYDSAFGDFLIYESGPGYQLDGFAGASVTTEQAIAQECAVKSRVGGTATVASYCVRAAAGAKVDMFSAYGCGLIYRTHVNEFYGGGVFMAYRLMKLLWGAVGPCSSVREITLTSPPVDEGVQLVQAFEFTSAADSGNRVYVVVNRDIDPSQLEAGDPLYNATPSGTYAVTVPTGLASASTLEYYANVGPFRQHDRYPEGFRRNPSTGALDVVDSLCVTFAEGWTAGSVPGSPGSIAIDDTYGAAAGGLPAGNCVLLHLTGCVDA